MRQIAHFVQRVRGEDVPPVITAQHAVEPLRIVEAERDSVRRGETVVAVVR